MVMPANTPLRVPVTTIISECHRLAFVRLKKTIEGVVVTLDETLDEELPPWDRRGGGGRFCLPEQTCSPTYQMS